MDNQARIEQIISEFVDDLNKGVSPRLYDLMANEPELTASLLPILDFTAWFKAIAVEVPKEEKETIKTKIFSPDSTVWSMSRLITRSDSETLARGEDFGLSKKHVEALSSDDMPFDLESPNNAAQKLSQKHGIPFFDLLGWMRQLISSVMQAQDSGRMSTIYARQDKEDSNGDKKQP